MGFILPIGVNRSLPGQVWLIELSKQGYFWFTECLGNHPTNAPVSLLHADGVIEYL